MNRRKRKEEAENQLLYPDLSEEYESAKSSLHETIISESAQTNTFLLMYEALCNLGCQPIVNADNTISVSCQGENFMMEFYGMYVRIWDLPWSQLKANNPALPDLMEAVNAANFNFGPTIVMTKPDDEGTICILSRRDIMLHPACPENTLYIQAVLDSFFSAKEEFFKEFHNAIYGKTGQQEARNPFGFAPAEED